MFTPLDLYFLTRIVALWLVVKFVGHCHMHSTNHISRSIYHTVVHLLYHHHHLESYSYFRLSSTICTLHTAISHLIIALKWWISHLLYAFRIHVRLGHSNALIKWKISMYIQFASVARNPEITVQFAVSPYANLAQLPWSLIQSHTSLHLVLGN